MSNELNPESCLFSLREISSVSATRRLNHHELATEILIRRLLRPVFVGDQYVGHDHAAQAVALCKEQRLWFDDQDLLPKFDATILTGLSADIRDGALDSLSVHPDCYRTFLVLYTDSYVVQNPTTFERRRALIHRTWALTRLSTAKIVAAVRDR
ncbi:hypothetical protein F66182_6753 [Fusarium sp. NRRL 66182]|nr:hypothetical protein F66182_6753 [Fusarium sp. NRRL 66182]